MRRQRTGSADVPAAASQIARLVAASRVNGIGIALAFPALLRNKTGAASLADART